jgi:hypothetical protein
LASTADTFRGRSKNLWADCPLLDYYAGKGGVFVGDDFTDNGPITAVTTDASLVDGRYMGFNSASQTHTYSTSQFGELVITADSTDNVASYVRTATQPFRITALAGDLWFEARIKVSDITVNKCGYIVGLWSNVACSVVVPLSTANPPIMATTGDFVGFRCPEESAGAFNAVYDTNDSDQTTDAEVVVQSAVHQAVVSTYVKLGMKFSRNYKGTGTPKLAWYVNGIEQTSTKTIPDNTATDFPATKSLGFLIGQRTGGTTSPVTTCDWWYCFQNEAAASAF